MVAQIDVISTKIPFISKTVKNESTQRYLFIGKTVEDHNQHKDTFYWWTVGDHRQAWGTIIIGETLGDHKQSWGPINSPILVKSDDYYPS